MRPWSAARRGGRFPALELEWADGAAPEVENLPPTPRTICSGRQNLAQKLMLTVPAAMVPRAIRVQRFDGASLYTGADGHDPPAPRRPACRDDAASTKPSKRRCVQQLR